MKNPTGLIIMLLILLGIFVYWWVNINKTNPTPINNSPSSPQEVKLNGVYTCLPHKGDGPSTMECAFGLKADDGSYYALDNSNVDNETVSFNTEDKVEVSGVLTPRDLLPPDSSVLKYDINGVIKVNSIVKIGGDAPTEPESDQTTLIDNITFKNPTDFGLAANKDQLPQSGVIPSCNPDFDYCIYYNGSKYADTNLEGVGVRIQKREDLATMDTCLKTQPDGFSGLVPQIKNAANYSTSIFSDLSDAGAGHFSHGNLYHVFNDSICYEFETRIGQSQFANYPTGTIKEFTAADDKDMEDVLYSIIKDIKLKDGTQIFN